MVQQNRGIQGIDEREIRRGVLHWDWPFEEQAIRQNMAKKLRVGILFGGRSGEHEVSLLSAASVLGAIDREKFDVTPIGITKEGRWLAAADARGLLNGDAGAGGRRLRAGDPEATPGAKLLHEGIPTLLAPEPGRQSRRAAWKARPSKSFFRCCTAPLARTARSRDCSSWRDCLRWLRRSGLGRRHGQGRDEAPVCRGRAAHRQTRHAAARGLGKSAAQGDRS